MVPIFGRRTILYGMIVLIACFLIAACSNNASTASSSVPTQPTLVQGTSIPSTPGVGPTVILTPTMIPGGNGQSQLITISDRILTIMHMSKQAGTDSNSITINLTLTIKNTGVKTIGNDAAYFQLISAEGDAFGLVTKEASNFFGPIASQSSRSGTIIFQIPAGAINGMRLMYRSDASTETIFVPLNLT